MKKFKVQSSRFKVDGTGKSLIIDGAAKSSRSRLGQFRRMQGGYPYLKFWTIAHSADIELFAAPLKKMLDNGV